jgi:lipoate-protein ligase B
MDGGVWQALGVVPYPISLAIQRRLAEERAAGLRPDTLLLLEHPPTITLGRRAGQEDLLWGAERLVGAGIVIARAGRGGRATYHGPGQLVGYAISRLSRHGRGVRRFVAQMETVLLDVAQGFGVTASRRAGHPGVWVRDRKLASIGIEVRRGISRHGFALNVDVDLRPFGAIVPCGVPGLEVTDLTREAGSRITVEAAALRVLAAWRRRFGEIVEEAANGLDAAG